MKTDLQEAARRLRSEGKSIKEIVSVLGVAKSSVSVWVRDIEMTDEQKANLHLRRSQLGDQNLGSKTNHERALKARDLAQQAGRERAQEIRPLHMMGCMLYWAEGAKARNGIYFVNSDPNMILLFMRFLREELGVADLDIAVRIHCHTHDAQEIQRIEEYWIALTALTFSNLKKTYIKTGSTSRKNILENGVCDIRVHRTDLVQHIFGAIQEYGNFENPAWLF